MGVRRMRTIKVKDEDELVEKHDGKIYCICDKFGKELFDVYEDDFITLTDQGIVDSETYNFIEELNETELKQYEEQYALKVIFTN